MPTALLPIVALIRRELVSSLRQRRFYVLMALIVCLAGFLIGVVVTSVPEDRLSPMLMAGLSRGIFQCIAFLLAIGAIVVIPATSGSSIVSEREEETLDLLAMTSAKPWHVIAAKLMNSIGYYLLLLIALMPFAASAFFLVGLDTDLLLRTLLIVTPTAFSCAAAGVMCSCLFRRPALAVGFSYLSMLTVIGLPGFLVLILLALFDIVRYNDSVYAIGIYSLPFVTFTDNVTIIATYGAGGRTAKILHSAYICGASFSVLTVMLVLIAHRLVAKRWGQSELPLSPRLKHKEQTPASRWGRFRPFPDSANTLYVKEAWFEMPLRSKAGQFIMIVPFGLAFSAAVLIALIRYTNTDESAFADAFLGWQLLQSLLLPALFIAATGNLFTKEHERSTFDALRATLLSPTAIVNGKLSASFRVGMLVFGSALAGSSPLLLVHEIPKLAILLGLVMLAECLLLAWGVSSLASVLNRRMTWAYVMAYSAMAMAVIGNMLLVVVLAETLFRVTQPDFWSFVAAFSPLSSFLIYAKQGAFGVYLRFHESPLMGLITLTYVALVAGATIGLTYAVFLGRYWGMAWRNPLNRGASPGGRLSEPHYGTADCRPDLSTNA